MNPKSPLLESDVRNIVRILGEVSSMKPSADAQRAYIMNELAGMLGTDTWVWGVSPLLEPGSQPVYLFHQTGGFDETRMTRYLQAVDHPDSGYMTTSIIESMTESGKPVTRDREGIIPSERFLASPAAPLWKAANIGPLVLALHPIPGHGVSVIGFYRPVDAPAYTEREALIAHIVLSEVPWLHEAGLPHLAARPAPSLPPRCRVILNQLATGASRHSIAADLGLSIQTVHGYIRKIFKHFGVHSQAELIARFSTGDGRHH
jgi:DNA-binding CsgD family transcriptional regulator